MTKILKKSLACLLVFALCFTAIASCLAVSAAAPAMSAGLDLYVERPSDPNHTNPEVCEGEKIRLQLGLGDLVKGTTMGISILMPEGVELSDLDISGWAPSPAGLQIVSKHLDTETRWFKMIVNVTSDGDWSYYIRFVVDESIPKNVVYSVYAIVEAATSSEAGDDNIFYKQTINRPMRVMTSHNVVTDDAVAATCEGTGLTEGSHCSRCEEVLVAQEEVKALGHAYDEGVVDPDATCTTDGVIKYTCKNDASHTYTEAISAKGHTPAADLVNNGDNHSVVCDVCKAVISTADHDFTDGDCACGAKKPAEGPVEIEVDNKIKFKDFRVSIGACLEMKIRVTTNTIDMNKYASYDLVVVPTKYDRTLGNAYNEIVLDPIVLTNEPTASYSVYKYTDIAMYELGLTMDVYVRCYDANKNIIATSAIQTVSAEQKLMEEYVKASATEKLKNVVADLLEMGAKAQIYFGYRNKDSKLYADLTDPNKNILVNKGINRDDLTENYAELPDEVAADWNAESTITAATNRLATGLSADKAPIPTFTIYKGTSLVRSDIELHVVYTSNKGTEYDFKVSGEDLRVSGTKLIYNCDVLAYYDTNVNVSVTFTYAGTRVWTQEYSVETGVKANLASTDEALASLVDAIAKFGVSARNYTGYGV